jgi:hypothetical protein
LKHWLHKPIIQKNRSICNNFHEFLPRFEAKFINKANNMVKLRFILHFSYVSWQISVVESSQWICQYINFLLKLLGAFVWIFMVFYEDIRWTLIKKCRQPIYTVVFNILDIFGNICKNFMNLYTDIKSKMIKNTNNLFKFQFLIHPS